MQIGTNTNNIADISVIIPCHNEALRLPKTIEKIHDFFTKEEKKAKQDGVQDTILLKEIIIVENGSTDATLDVVADLIKKYSDARIECIVSEKGKGNAVKKGVENAMGTHVLVMDADSSTDIVVLNDMKKYLFDFDIVNTSRHLSGTKIVNKQSFLRRLFGNVFHFFVRVFLRPKVTDTQNGFKLFRTIVAKKVFNEIKTTGWVSELELFLLARKYTYTVAEIPVHWTNDSASTMKAGDVWGIFKDMLYILYKYH